MAGGWVWEQTLIQDWYADEPYSHVFGIPQ